MSAPGFVTELLDFIRFEAEGACRPWRRAASRRRWRRNNAERPKVCYCGRPGTVRRTAEHMPGNLYATHGGPVWWFCEDHATVPLDTPWCNGRPMVQTSDGVWVES